ncbi:MAG: hypothetical protein ACREJB_19470, partial [Planctomycetaceae bacterium]
MSRLSPFVLAAGCLLLFVAADSARTEPKAASLQIAQADPAADSAETKPAAPKKNYRGRLPNNYGKLGVSSVQRQTIYNIQGTYNEQIEALEMQIAELKKKRDEEVFNVLT